LAGVLAHDSSRRCGKTGAGLFGIFLHVDVSGHRDLGVYAGVSRKRVREVGELIVKEMLGLSSTLTGDELEKAKRHLKGNMLLALESTNSRMNNIARQEMYFGRYISLMRSSDLSTG